MNMSADWGEMAPRAIGRRRVRETKGSRLRSHRSFIAQPAPRMMMEPEKKRRVVVRIVDGGMGRVVVRGERECMEARSVEKRQGKKR